MRRRQKEEEGGRREEEEEGRRREEEMEKERREEEGGDGEGEKRGGGGRDGENIISISTIACYYCTHTHTHTNTNTHTHIHKHTHTHTHTLTNSLNKHYKGYNTTVPHGIAGDDCCIVQLIGHKTANINHGFIA